MQRILPGFVKRGVRAIGSRAIDWLREWTRPNNHGLVGGVVADATRSNAELMLENALLRQQLIVVSRQAKRPPMSWRERGIMVLLVSKLRT
jgi:putative transposase